MLCLPLVMTSVCFMIPAVIAARKKGRNKDAMLISCMALTSTCFHSTYHTMAYVLDKFLAHGFGVYYTSLAVTEAVFRKRCVPLVFTAGTLMCCGLEECVSQTSRLRVPMHIGIHMGAIAALTHHFATNDAPK